MTTPNQYLNKELSWLEFNARVLDEALTPSVPIAERLKFLSIFTSNFDEFVMVRVAGLKKMEQEGIRASDSPDAMEVQQVLATIRQRSQELVHAQYQCLKQDVLPGLAALDLAILRIDQLSPAQRAEVDAFFELEVSPVLTPLGVDPAHPFPFLANQSVYLVVVPKQVLSLPEGEMGIGFVEVPSVLPRLVAVTADRPGKHVFVLLEDLIAAHLQSLFFGFQVEVSYPIRVLRNLDYSLLENTVVDLLKAVQREVFNREMQEIVRVEVDEAMPEQLVSYLRQRLSVTDTEIYRVPRPLHLPGLMALYAGAPEVAKDPAFNPRLPKALASADDIFSVISKQDLLVHHPYESFYAVTEFLASAALDPHVLAIKQTLYRSAGDSPIIDALIAAAENGKKVTAVVELKARFDERNNISWARRLERAGVNVVFGFVGLKTHCKMTLVVRRERNKLIRYVHLSTGNYNSSTAKLYTDVGLFTVHPGIGQDVSTIFNLITGFDVITSSNRIPDEAIVNKLAKLAVSPINVRATIIKAIKQECEFAKKNGTGFIRAKMNALVDKDIIDALYDASRAGVRVELIVRGICCLIPGVPGLSDNIEIISIIDRFLEHSRIWHFQAGGEHKVFISSADWMPRNMDRRIEIVIPIENQLVKSRLIEEVLATSWADRAKARVLTASGSYQRRQLEAGKEPLRSQQRFIDIAREGGIQSIPYDIAIRHQPSSKGQRPIAKKKERKKAADTPSPPLAPGTASTQVPAATPPSEQKPATTAPAPESGQAPAPAAPVTALVVTLPGPAAKR